MKNQTYVGINRDIELPKGGFLLIEDEARVLDRSRVFDPTTHSFNPLKDLDYHKASAFIDTLDALFSRGENTLTKDTGLEFIAEQLDYFITHRTTPILEHFMPEPTTKSSTGHIWADGKIRRLLRSPVLKKMLSNNNFSFNPRSKIIARVNRAELGTFDSLAATLFLINNSEAQIIIPNFGPYAREMHSSLLDQDRLIIGVNLLDELPPKLRQLVLLTETIPSGTTFKDASALAEAARHVWGTDGFSSFVTHAMNVTPPPLVTYRDPALITDRTRKFVANQPKAPLKRHKSVIEDEGPFELLG